MRRVVLSLVLTTLAAGSCSVSHRSDEFTCGLDSRCASNRVCVDGVCVIRDDAGVVPDALARACPTQCTSCDLDAKSCTIDCLTNPSACSQLVTCPAGWSCEIGCSTPNSCRNGVNCTLGSACKITCSGRQSCDGVLCGPGPCSVECAGRDSCADVTCGPACSCEVTCSFASSCLALSCKSPDCEVPDGCALDGAGCNTCP